MKIFKSKFGWSTTAHSKNKDGSQNQCYIDIGFQKGAEPIQELEGDLVFKGKDGIDRSCFLSSYKKNDGSVAPKLVILSQTRYEQTSLAGDRDVTGHTVTGNTWTSEKPNNNVEIDVSELPFY